MSKIEILDSTLRDGAQGFGVSYSVLDKLAIIKHLDNIGVDYIEAGNPASNPKDRELFEELKKIELKNSKLAAFGATRRKDTKPEEDSNLKAILDAGTEVCVIFGKCWMLHVSNVLETTAEENLSMIADSCRYLKAMGKKVIFDAEHFFDGYRDNRDYALAALKTAQDNGADTVVLCDTNGGTFPTEAIGILWDVKTNITKAQVGVHFHDDCGMAVANSVLCAREGIAQIQGTFIGNGERCGNANLSTIIPNLQLKLGIECIPQENLKKLAQTAREIASVDNADLDSKMPFVGSGAFTHKAGMHAAGVLKTPRSFEHVDPYLVGNERKFPASEISGKAVIFERVREILPELKKNSPESEKILEELKRLENIGYQFEGADASFELLVRRQMGLYKSYFELINYRIFTGHDYGNEMVEPATATVKTRVGDTVNLMASEGNGPINALDKALRKSLLNFYPVLSEVELTDYKVRVLGSSNATASTVRVAITSTDGNNYFTTMGVSDDVVDASWKALADSVNYFLLKRLG